MLGNYKPVSVRGKLQGLHSQNTVPIHAFTQTGNVNLKFLLGSLHMAFLHIFPSHFCLFSPPCTFTCSVSLPSVFPAPLSLSSALECASQQYLMKVWLTGRCCVLSVCVFMFHVRTCSLLNETRDKDCQQEKSQTHLGRIGYFLW